MERGKKRVREGEREGKWVDRKRGGEKEEEEKETGRRERKKKVG